MYIRTFVNITDLTVLAWTVSVARKGIWRQLFDSSNEKYRLLIVKILEQSGDEMLLNNF